MEINQVLKALQQHITVRRKGWVPFGLYLKVILNDDREDCILVNKEGDYIKWTWGYDDLTAKDWEIVDIS